ncbi:MAG: hypothetical protein AB7J40_05380 [Candidatus Altimarinota bacterium]
MSQIETNNKLGLHSTPSENHDARSVLPPSPITETRSGVSTVFSLSVHTLRPDANPLSDLEGNFSTISELVEWAISDINAALTKYGFEPVKNGLSHEESDPEKLKAYRKYYDISAGHIENALLASAPEELKSRYPEAALRAYFTETWRKTFRGNINSVSTQEFMLAVYKRAEIILDELCEIGEDGKVRLAYKFFHDLSEKRVAKILSEIASMESGVEVSEPEFKYLVDVAVETFVYYARMRVNGPLFRCLLSILDQFYTRRDEVRAGKSYEQITDPETYQPIPSEKVKQLLLKNVFRKE